MKTHKINILGDHIYTSTKNKPSLLNINLILKNGHYSIDKSKIIQVKGISYTAKKTLIYDNELTVYDDVYGERKITKEQFKDYRCNSITSPYVLVPYDQEYDIFKEKEIIKSKLNKDYVPKQPSLKDLYEQFNIDAKILKNETKGVLNMFKTGNISKTALNYFQHVCKDIFPENINQDEAIWINNASIGAFIFAKKYKGEAYKYDVCSKYPSIMKSHNFFIPIKRGIFKKITNDEFNDVLSIGIYRCKIEGETNLFKFNKNNYYTSTDILIAKN